MLTAFQGLLALTIVHANETDGDQENPADEVVEDNLTMEEASVREASADNEETEELDSEIEQDEDSQESNEEITEADQTIAAADDNLQLSDCTTESSDDAEGKPTTGADEAVEAAADNDLDTPTDSDVASLTQSRDSDEETSEVVAPLLHLGVIDEVYDFVEEFHHSQSSNVEAASVNTQDSAGGEKKAAIFEHPRAGGDARIEYEVTLPQLESNENLILHFSIGLRDGVDFELPHTKPDGVQFAVSVSGERRFESFSITCQWDEHIIDLSDFAGRTITMAFLTNCNGEENTYYDWALWGNPRILKLTRVSLPTEKGETESRMRRGLAVGLLEGESPELSVAEFDFGVSTWISEIGDGLCQRIQSRAGRSIVELALYTEQPKLEITTFGSTASLITAREDFELQCIIRNNGGVPLEPIHEASVSINRIKLRRGRSTHLLKTLNPGEETTFLWSIRSFSRESIARVSISLRYQMPTGEIRQGVEEIVTIHTAIPKISPQIATELHTYDLTDYVVTENTHLRALFVRGNRGFEYYLLFVGKSGRYRQVAACSTLSEIRYRNSAGSVQHTKITPSIYRLAGNNRDESIVLLSSEEKDGDGVLWSYEARFSLSDDSKRLKVQYRLAADQARELITFNGPILHVGEATFAESKTAALFPGLEFLEGDERSSSTRDVAPPLNNRLVPHPYKITIPLMVVEHNRTLVGLLWDALQPWDGERNMLSAVFASPNWHEHQKNHLMGLFLPPPADWVEENHPGTSRPYLLKANQPVTLKAQIVIDGNASILDAISHWTDAYGAPEPLEAPRSDEEELLLSRHGFMTTVWDAETGSARQCVGWPPGNAPGFATMLWYDYLVQTQDDAVRDESVRQRVLEIAKKTIRESGPGGLVSPAFCHILKWETPFYFGHVEAGLDRLKEMMQGLTDAQEADGSWRFHPTTDRAKTLGQEGDAVLGTCAHSVLMLLKHARVTGDTESLEAGLKGLKFMARFNVPRGTKSWECPLYAPDLLAAAHALGAYIEAYEVTNNKLYLEWAEHWAKTGLLFLYHWHLPDRPGMRFASIPVFGATFYTQSWFGVPVQWNGLVYAYYLQHLAKHIPEDANPYPRQFWSKVAEGITVSAMYQQWTEGELKGTHPEGFYSFCTEGRGPHINPEGIMVNLFTLRGLDPDISTAIIHNQQKPIHLSTGAKIEKFSQNDSGRLPYALRYVQHETSHSIITGYGGKPSAIQAQTEDIPVVDDLESAESGWLYREEKDMIFIKYKHPTGEMAFEILPPATAEPIEASNEETEPNAATEIQEKLND